MKKLFVTLLLLVVAGSLSAQNAGGNNAKPVEYVSVFITFKADRCPQDSLAAYGVLLQNDEGVTAAALVRADRYAAFCASGLVASVQPSTRVYLNPDQTKMAGSVAPAPKPVPTAKAEHPLTPVTTKQVAAEAEADGSSVRRADPPVQRRPRAQQGIRRHIIPEQDIRDDEAEGAYIGFLFGGSRNVVKPVATPCSGTWYSNRGVNFDVMAGYQFNEWFGIRSGLQVLSKNYSTDLVVDGRTYGTTYRDTYLQLPVMADFSVGNEVVRLHALVGGYASWWMTQRLSGLVWRTNGYYWGTTYNTFYTGVDNRFDAGLAGGLDLSIRVAPDWLLHFEGDYYHGLTSIMKSPYCARNRTWTFGFGFSHQF